MAVRARKARRLKLEFQQKTGRSTPEPQMEEIARSNDLEIEGAVQPGRLRKPEAGRVLSASEFTEIVKQCVQNSVSFNRGVYGKLSAIYHDGSSFFEVMKSEEVEGEAAIGALLAPIIQFLDDLLKNSGIGKQDIINSLDEKYKLFTEAYIPYKMPGASSRYGQLLCFYAHMTTCLSTGGSSINAWSIRKHVSR
jgi:hypothetical protein